MATPVLITSKYVPVGTYIGQIIRPRPANVAVDARYPAIIGKGNRLALGRNLGIYRSFVYEETLNFPLNSPFQATLLYQADGSKDSPVRLYKSDGTLIRNDQWVFATVGSTSNKAVVINTEAYDPAATYYFDYQSVNRAVLDPLPVEDLREILSVGNSEDQPQYNEFIDYLVKTSVTNPVADSGNTYITRTVEAPSKYVGTGVGTIISSSSIYTHNYNRYFTIICTGAGGAAPNRTASFRWKAEPVSAGNSTAPPNPLCDDDTSDWPTFTLDEATPATLTQSLEYGVILTLAFGVTNFNTGDGWQFNALGPGIVEKDDRYNNTNQYTEASTVSIVSTSLDALCTVDVDSYTSSYNSSFKLECIATAGAGTGNYTANFIWAQYGDTQPFSDGEIVMSEPLSNLTFTLALGIDITLDPGASNFNVGDTISFNVYAPMIRYQGKDNRGITLTMGTVVEASLETTISGSFSTDTQEGSFGSFTGVVTKFGDATQNGRFTLNDNLIFVMRNAYRRGTTDITGAQSQIQTADIYTAAATNDGYIDWSLTVKTTETRLTSEAYQDVMGTVTGTVGAWYVILTNIPEAASVVVTDAGGPVSSTEVTGTAFVILISGEPSLTLTIAYEYKGQEPDPGQIYFLTATYLRPDNLYDTPILILDRDAGKDLLAPSTADNHLYIANEIAWDHDVSGVYYVQVKDEDGDGIYNNNDFKTALLATEETSAITDRIVLSNWGTLATQLSVNVKANDPFEKRESVDWFGVPVGTLIGDDTTQDTIRYYARNTLQVYGNSPAHGTRVLHGSTYCKKTITLSTGVTQQVTLDGSFVSVALASIVSSFDDPAATILNKILSGFDEVEVHTDPENVSLGSSSVIFFTDEGSSVYRIKEDVTVDILAPEYQLISGTIQRHTTVKGIRTGLEPLIATVVVSGQAGVNLVRSQLGGLLLSRLSRGLIAPYQDVDGNERKFDPGADVKVYRDTTDTTLYHFIYAFWIKKPIKRLFGLYSVDSNEFGI